MCDTKHTIYLKMCMELAEASKCRKLHVASLIVHKHKIIATGVNGTLPGHENCCDKFAHLTDDEFVNAHNGWSSRNEIHAEMSALLTAAKSSTEIKEDSIMYCTHEPCDNCAKHIAYTGIKEVYFIHKYHNNLSDNIFGLTLKQLSI